MQAPLEARITWMSLLTSSGIMTKENSLRSRLVYDIGVGLFVAKIFCDLEIYRDSKSCQEFGW